MHYWRASTVTPIFEPGPEYLRSVAAEIFEKSDGQLDIKVYAGGVLGFEQKDNLRVMQIGGVEVALGMLANAAGDVPPADLCMLPFLAPSYEDIPTMIEAEKELWAEELPKWDAMLLAEYATSPQTVTAKRLVDTVEAWKGLKIRAWSKMLVEICNIMGAAPIDVPYAEAYAATATGIVDAHVWSVASVYDQKLWELGLNYVNRWDMTYGNDGVLVNATAFNALSPDLQKLVVDTFAKWEPWIWDQEYGAMEDIIVDLKAEGMTIIKVNPEEKAKIAEALSPLWDDWLDRSGPEGLKWLNHVLAAVGKPAYK